MLDGGSSSNDAAVAASGDGSLAGDGVDRVRLGCSLVLKSEGLNVGRGDMSEGREPVELDVPKGESEGSGDSGGWTSKNKTKENNQKEFFKLNEEWRVKVLPVRMESADDPMIRRMVAMRHPSCCCCFGQADRLAKSASQRIQ
jgi:hypothetical protein